MSGRKVIYYRLESIRFLRHNVHPKYNNQNKELRSGEVAWRVRYNFEVKQVDAEWDEVTIDTTVWLDRNYDSKQLGELTTESVYRVPAGLSFKDKQDTLSVTINQACQHAQGGWTVKNKNVLGKFIPQLYDRALDDEVTLQRMIYEKWDW